MSWHSASINSSFNTPSSTSWCRVDDHSLKLC